MRVSGQFDKRPLEETSESLVRRLPSHDTLEMTYGHCHFQDNLPIRETRDVQLDWRYTPARGNDPAIKTTFICKSSERKARTMSPRDHTCAINASFLSGVVMASLETFVSSSTTKSHQQNLRLTGAEHDKNNSLRRSITDLNLLLSRSRPGSPFLLSISSCRISRVASERSWSILACLVGRLPSGDTKIDAL